MIKTFLLLCPVFALCAGDASFTPPKDWKPMEPSKLAPKVKMGFTTKGKKELSPSLNLAVESVTVSLPVYVKAVKELYEKNKQCRYRDFGTIQTKAGEAKLTEIDLATKLGPARLLQMIYLQDGNAYVLTAAAHKDELPQFYETFQEAFRSFTLDKLE